MQTKKIINMIGAHTEGEATRIITGGTYFITGKTMKDKLDFLKSDPSFLRFCLFEPRGSAALTAALITEPVTEGAHVGFIPFQPLGPIAFSGSTAISAVTVLLETGMLPMNEQASETIIYLDTAVGVVKAVASCSLGRVNSVTLESAPAFVYEENYRLDVPNVGQVCVDIAFGGAFFAICDVTQFANYTINVENADKLVSLGMQIRNTAHEQIAVKHPTLEHIKSVDFFLFTDSKQESKGQGMHANVLAPGRLDRSPCGAGSMARLPLLHKQGKLLPDMSYVSNSVLGTTFKVNTIKETKVGNFPALVPSLTGRAWLYSSEQVFLHPDDPFPQGFTVADTWGSVVS